MNNVQLNLIQKIPGLESSKANNLGLDIGKQVPIPGILALEFHPGSVVDVVDKEMQPQIMKLSKISVKLENENQTPPALASTKVADNINSDTDSQRKLDSACILENDHAVKVKDSLTPCQPVLDESDSTNEPLAHHLDQDIEHKADLPVVTSHPSCPILSLPLDSNKVEDSETQKIAHHTQRGTISLKTEFEIQPKTKIFPSPLNATISDTNSIKDISIDDNESAGLDRTDGSTRRLVVQQRESLTLALERHPDREARPVTVYQNFDKLSGAWLLALPGPETGISSKVFSEAMAAHLCLPSLAVVTDGWVGKNTVRGGAVIDQFGNAIMNWTWLFFMALCITPRRTPPWGGARMWKEISPPPF